MELIRVAGILQNSVNVNGPGNRFVIFAQGCNHRCEGCFNQHTWDTEGGKLMSIAEIMDLIKKDPLLDGVTFSGGDPFLQAKNFGILAEEIKAFNKKLSIWCYTGFEYERLRYLEYGTNFWDLMSEIDVLVDGKFEIDNQFSDDDIGRITKEKGLEDLFNPYRGSKNQRVIDVRKTLKKRKIQLVKEFEI